MENHLIASNYQRLVARIKAAAHTYQRNPDDIHIIAVSKKQDSNCIRQAYALGLRAFGENYLQEALDKKQTLADLSIEWHFIGAIQSNKTQLISQHFSWVHTLARDHIASRINAQRPSQLPPINCCIQYNISQDPRKAGVCSDAQLFALAEQISTLPRLRLRGLMTVPENNVQQNSAAFAKLADKLQWLNNQLPQLTLDTLSMGMSADFETAIGHGSTMIRIGSALFGSRAM